MDRTRSISLAAAGSLALAGCAAPSRAAQHDTAVPQVRVVGAPSVVTATDGRRHLVYELVVDNGTRSRVRLDRLQVVDPAREDVVASYAGDAIERIAVDARSAEPTRTLARGSGALILLDVPCAAARAFPCASSTGWSSRSEHGRGA